MHLTRVSISGFKSFARPTELRFGRELTAIVGPNGSGKSNVLDAVRWCLGEQSMKAIRGKRSTDVLFAGATGRSRANVASVELVLDNADRLVPLDFAEVTIARRLHRDGEAEYLLNGRPARLADISLLLAQANFGQRSYSIVGQGMVDHVIAATPSERLQFFIEATGVRQFQLRRDEAVGKLNLTAANLQEAASRLAELSPVLHSLTRQVKRLERRDQLAAELAQWQRTYYWHRAAASNDEKVLLYRRLHDAEAKQQAARAAVEAARRAAAEAAGGQQRTELFRQLQASHAAALAERDQLLRTATLAAAEEALDRAVAEATPSRSAASLPRVVASLRQLAQQLGQPQADLAAARAAIAEAADDLEEIHRRNEGLPAAAVKKVQETLQRAVGTARKPAQDARLAAAEAAVAAAAEALADAHRQAQGHEQQRAKAQAELQAATEALGREDAAVAAIQVEVARWQAQAEDLAAEVHRELRCDLAQLGNDLGLKLGDQGGPEAWQEKIQRLKDQVAQAGGIDPEVVAEYQQVKQRCDFLSEQTEDLQRAMAELQKVVRELDRTIEKQFHENFQKINQQFAHYFKTLFNGGRASLEIVTLQHDEPDTPEDDGIDVRARHASPPPESPAAEAGPLGNVGIQVDACPPGKKVNAVQALSGGERTLLSTALLCAIIACNPSPFVIMDEVDAALDEANAERLATIFHELNGKTQIIVITHNRVIMQHADALYGVTMGPEGDSRVLSVSLKDAAAAG